MGRYLNPFVDFAFKFIFGREESKPFLIDLLNETLRDEPGFSPIVELEYLDKEQSRISKTVRGVIYDIHCRTSNNKHFTVEMQNSPQPYFFDRIIYYASKAIVDQGVPGNHWKFTYMPVYSISFMNFVMDTHPDDFRIDVALCDLRTNKQFSNKVRYIFLQTPLFRDKKMEDCKDGFEEWMYNIINMKDMDAMAFTHKKNLFEKLGDMVSYASLSNEERMAYDADLKAYRDLTGQLEYAKMEGIEQGQAQLIRNMAESGADIDLISSLTKIAIDEVKRILGK